MQKIILSILSSAVIIWNELRSRGEKSSKDKHTSEGGKK